MKKTVEVKTYKDKTVKVKSDKTITVEKNKMGKSVIKQNGKIIGEQG